MATLGGTVGLNLVGSFRWPDAVHCFVLVFKVFRGDDFSKLVRHGVWERKLTDGRMNMENLQNLACPVPPPM